MEHALAGTLISIPGEPEPFIELEPLDMDDSSGQRAETLLTTLLVRWWQDALSTEELPQAGALATASPTGKPAVRIVLLKWITRNLEFVFFGNRSSTKGKHLTENPQAAMVFFFPRLYRQLRVEGPVEELPVRETQTYFRSRPRISRISAWISPQSSRIPSRGWLEEALRTHLNSTPPNIPPAEWTGWKLFATSIEFWQGRPGRLHDRLLFIREPSGNLPVWKCMRLAP